MNDRTAQVLIDSLIAGDITPVQHAQLQDILKADPAARELLRRKMDLESSLRTWATEDPPTTVERHLKPTGIKLNRWSWLTVAALIAVVIVPVVIWSQREIPNQQTANLGSENDLVGAIQQQSDCVWNDRSAIADDSFSIGTLSLAKGIAELNFHSGAKVVLQAPCKLQVLSPTSAMLLSGNFFADVNELAEQFTLQTPELSISHEGTEFAVAIDDSSTEIHVFDGSVTWKPLEATADKTGSDESRITSGQARRFLRRRPGRPDRIAFGSRRFARRLKEKVQSVAGESLLAYDGFENPANRLRPAKNGFGWSGGWVPNGPDTELPTIISAAAGDALGIKQSGIKKLQLKNRQGMHRQLQSVISVDNDPLFISFLASCPKGTADTNINRLLRVALLPVDLAETKSRPRRGRVAFGVTDEGLPFIKSGSQITQSAPAVVPGITYLVVLQVRRTTKGTELRVRFFHADETIPAVTPSVWTVSGQPIKGKFQTRAIRIGAGRDATWFFDELKIGKSWQAVVPNDLQMAK